MATKSDVVATIITATLNLAGTQGWRTVTLAAIATESGQKLDRVHAEFPTKDAILVAFNRRIDAEVLKEPLDGDGTVRDRLFDLIMRRFDALGPHRPAIRAILQGTLGDPLAALAGLCAAHRSMSMTLEAAGVSASGPFGRLRAKALSALYLRTLYMWLQNDGDDERIMAQLNKSLSRAEQIATSFAKRRERRRAGGGEANAASAADASDQG